MKRFYEIVDVVAGRDGHEIVLDGKPVRTPAKRRLVVPTEALANAIAEEWRNQGDRLDPPSMTLTQLANTGIDRVPRFRSRIVDEIVRYAETDLVCYRVDAPADLVRHQTEVWQPLVDWLAEALGVRLAVTESIVPLEQPADAVDALKAAVDRHDDLALAALHSATAACGSVVIALAIAAGRLDAAQAFAAAHVDEIFQMERWGRDAEAIERHDRIRDEIDKTARFLALCRQST